MEQSSSQEVNSHSANQEIPRLLWNPKVHYHVHNRPPLAPILSQMNQIHTFAPYFPKIYSIVIHLRLDLPDGPFPSRLPTKILFVRGVRSSPKTAPHTWVSFLFDGMARPRIAAGEEMLIYLQLGDLAWGYYPSRDAAEMTVSFKPELGSNSWLLQ
jgi:hypothetical protein